MLCTLAGPLEHAQGQVTEWQRKTPAHHQSHPLVHLLGLSLLFTFILLLIFFILPLLLVTSITGGYIQPLGLIVTAALSLEQLFLQAYSNPQ